MLADAVGADKMVESAAAHAGKETFEYLIIVNSIVNPRRAGYKSLKQSRTRPDRRLL